MPPHNLIPSTNNCRHVEHYKQSDGFYSYKFISSNFMGLCWENIGVKNILLRCNECDYNGIYLQACLHCVYFGCTKHGHMQRHVAEKSHHLAVTLKLGIVKCYACKEWIQSKMICEKIGDTFMNWSCFLNFVDEAGLTGIRNLDDLFHPESIIHSFGQRLPVQKNSVIGLRGLVNMGNTCFVNCIIQTLAHTPILREYFKSPKVVCHCTQPSMCLVCELRATVSAFDSQDKTAMSQINLICLLWKNASHLSGYVQHDAHELFIALIEVLHKHSSPTQDEQSGLECSCIVDKIFTGQLQSDLKCKHCNAVSSICEPFWDISLNISNADAVVGGCEKKEGLSLYDLLEEFTSAEHLESTTWKICTHCSRKQESTKQLTLYKLPIIICLHLKRFGHSVAKSHRKISTMVSFPENLDLLKFTSGYEAFQREMAQNPEEMNPLKLGRSTQYALFSVVNHRGSMNSGHYMCYIRQKKDMWYKCDDTVITKVSVSEVLNSESYMLFYHKTDLEYE